MSRAKFEVLLLVLPDRHVRRAIGQNVGRHQVRIGIETDGCVLAVLAGLLLELRHAVEPAETRDAVEDPCQLRMRGHLALIEQDALLWVEARRDVGGRNPPDRVLQLLGILPDRDRVQIDDAVDALMRLLHLDPLQHGAEIVAEMQAARGLHAREDALFELHG